MNLETIINDNLIFINQDLTQAVDVIKFAGNQLEKFGYCTAQYTEAMLTVFNDFPGVIVLDDGVAMPHARPEMGSLKDGLVIITLKNSIDFFNEDFELVDTVIGLCSTGSDNHIRLMQLVGGLIENGIQQQKFSNKQDVLTFIHKINNDLEIE